MFYKKLILLGFVVFLFLPSITVDKLKGLTMYEHEKIMGLAEECNEIVITIDLKNDAPDLDEWNAAINTIKDWGKSLTHTLKEKSPHVKIDVKIAGHCCYKDPQ